MTEPRHARIAADLPSDAVTRVWHAPTLTLLGDARTLTEAGGSQTADGGGEQAMLIS